MEQISIKGHTYSKPESKTNRLHMLQNSSTGAALKIVKHEYGKYWKYKQIKLSR